MNRRQIMAGVAVLAFAVDLALVIFDAGSLKANAGLLYLGLAFLAASAMV